MTTPSRRARRASGEAEVWALATTAAEEAVDRKATDVVLLDLRELTSATDYFVLATGESDVQVRAIADRIAERLAEAGAKPWHVEGLQHARWVLIDYIDFVVHVFHSEARAFYELERLWADAGVTSFTDSSEGTESAEPLQD